MLQLPNGKMDRSFTSYQVDDRSYIAYIKREIHREVSNCRFTETQVGEIDIIVSELSSNLVKHVGSGEFLYRAYDVDESESLFEIISIDDGAGMADPLKMMKDGVSTTNTLGQGLGAISRLSTAFQLYSMPGWGTVLYVRYSRKNEDIIKQKGPQLDIRAVCVNKRNETVCGDGYSVKKNDSTIKIFLGDGLGHGEYANDAVRTAADFFSGCPETDPVDIIRQMHEKVRRTRGLVASVAVLDLKRQRWQVCAVGNITTRLYSGISFRNYMSYNGTIGLNIPTSLKGSVFEVERNQHLIMNSDGIRSRWDLAKYPSILKYDGAVIGAAVYKDFGRGTDDTSILIAKVI